MNVWTTPGTLPFSRLAEALKEIAILSQAKTIDWVDDPTVRSPAYMLSWDGAQWILRQSGRMDVINLGAQLTAKNVLAKLPQAKASLLVNVPPSKELSATLTPDPLSRWKLTAAPAAAKYVLVGTYSHDNLAYAWVSKDVLEQADSVGVSKPSEATCATASPYPARTDWKPLAGPTAVEDTGRELIALATQLARIRQWLELPAPPSDAASYPFHLALKRDDGALIHDVATGGEHVSMLLKSDTDVPVGLTSRWVYVLDLNCQGNGTLLYPSAGVNNHLPAHGSSKRRSPSRTRVFTSANLSAQTR